MPARTIVACVASRINSVGVMRFPLEWMRTGCPEASNCFRGLLSVAAKLDNATNINSVTIVPFECKSTRRPYLENTEGMVLQTVGRYCGPES